MYISLCFVDTSITKDLIIGIPNTSFNLITGYCYLTRTMIIHLCDLVTCCAALMCSHRVGPEYHIRHEDEQIPLFVYTPQPTPLETQETPFRSPC
jgi:hypothetical protein